MDVVWARQAVKILEDPELNYKVKGKSSHEEVPFLSYFFKPPKEVFDGNKKKYHLTNES